MTTGLIGTVLTMSTTNGSGAVTRPSTGVRTADASGTAVAGCRGGSTAGRDRSTR
ncbi:hypothetical protein [Micromonospora sp. NPDC005171]|uniref:hypothetical protein n=1 Tax=Micromonospora sp. NPDC005171 TaxID=3156866 RepID=UPI0033A52296